MTVTELNKYLTKINVQGYDNKYKAVQNFIKYAPEMFEHIKAHSIKKDKIKGPNFIKYETFLEMINKECFTAPELTRFLTVVPASELSSYFSKILIQNVNDSFEAMLHDGN